MNMPRLAHAVKKTLFVLAATLLSLAIFANGWVLSTAVGRMHAAVAFSAQCMTGDAPKYDAILVLGAGIKEDSTPNIMLKDRLDTAVLLYNAKAAPIIIVSGDKREGYDEVNAMTVYLQGKSVPKECIIADTKGFSTRESIENLKDTAQGAERILIVTQAYHLPRALFVAATTDIDAVGIEAFPRTYSFFAQSFRELREFAARVKDVLFIFS